MKKSFLFLIFLLILPFAAATESGYCKITKDNKVGYWGFDSDGAKDFCDLLGTILNLSTNWIPDDEFGANSAERSSDFCDGWTGECEFDVSDEIGDNGPGRRNRSTCNELWECNDWSECSLGTQERYCRDINSCGTYEYMPEETRVCDGTEITVINGDSGNVANEENTEGETSKFNTLSAVTIGGVIAAIIALITVVILLVVRR